MWEAVARIVLKYRWVLLVLLLVSTIFMAYHASKVELSYEFSKAIPTDNPKYKAYQEFRKKFGEDGNLLVIGIQTNQFFTQTFYNDYTTLVETIRKVPSVEDILSIPAATNLVKDTVSEKLLASRIFPEGVLSQATIDSAKHVFFNLPFYNGLLYNPASNAYLMGIRINKDVLNSKRRTGVVNQIVKAGNEFGARHQIEMHYSGLPLIRTSMATRIAGEMRWFLAGSILLSAIILLLFFRSFSATLLSLSVVIIGVVWSLGTMHLLGYNITLLNALIPPLVVVIGIPNCIYFLNKYHTSYNDTGEKRSALIEMIRKMGIVTLFCNIAAAIGFAVFALTKSAILKEFGVVAGINIMALFFISIVLIPAVLSFLPAPKERHTKYLENRWLLAILDKLEIWSLHHQKAIYGFTALILAISVIGIFRLKSEGFIVDDLPKTDKLYVDLKFFEKNFKGVMPLEIVIDTKKKRGVTRNLSTLLKIDSLSQFLASMPEIGRPL